MTVPGGVPNLPQGALTLDNLAAMLQDMSPAAMRERADERYPAIFHESTGGNPALDLTPFGVINFLFAGFNSTVANADPADINGPEDLPDLLWQFIKALPVVGQFVELLEALLGTYEGDDENLLAIKALLTPIRAAVTAVQTLIDVFLSGLTGSTTQGNDVSAIPLALISAGVQIPAQLLITFFGILTGQQAQINGLQNQLTSGSTAALTDDFATATVAGYTNIVGVLAVSTRGPYLQTPALAAAYRNAGPSTDRHGAVFTLSGKMRGTIRVAICSDPAMSNYAALEVYCGFSGDAVRIVTGTSPTVTAIRRQVDYTGAQNLQNTNTFEIWYEPATNTFHALLNGLGIMAWPDADNDVTHGTGSRKVVVVTNADDSPEDGTWGSGIGKVTVNDK